MFHLAERNLEPEIMDDPRLDRVEHLQALRGLERVNIVCGTASRMWASIERFFRDEPRRPVTLMDVGCGNAALLRSLCRKAARQQIPVELVGCDFSSQALELARAACDKEGFPIQLHQLDVTHDELPLHSDVIMCSLFLHHFTGLQVVEILRKFARAARHLVLIDDLIRSRIGYALCGIGVHVLTRSRVVHADGPQSVRAAFTLSEMRQLLESAGFHGASVHRHWPERFLVNYCVSEHISGVAHV